MRPILRVIDAKVPNVEVNALFIQPTMWCANNCTGCYSKAYLCADFQTPIEEQLELFNWFYKGEEGCWANQITISIDRMPNGSGEYQNHRVHMLQWFTHPITMILNDLRPKYGCPEVHMTAHSFNEVRTWVNLGGKYGEEYATVLDMLSLSRISLSTLPRIKELIAVGANINYNHMIPADITTKNIDSYIERMKQIGEVVNSIYLIIFKESMGKKLPMGNKTDAAKRDHRRRSRLSHELAVINTLRSRLPKHVWQKVRVDGCLQDATKYLRTGESCSSNVSRFQVWPDGSVTGCPYAISSLGAIGRTASHITENIRRARGQNEFERRCYLPKILDSLSRRSKDK